MKAADRRVLFSSATDDHATPQDLFDRLDRIYDFTLDVCASASNAKCKEYFTADDDGLSWDWWGSCWMNPPYGRGITGKWVEKAWSEARRPGCTVVALLPARTDTLWFHNFIEPLVRPGHVTFIKGRLKFGGAKDSAPFPSMLVEFGFNKKETP